MKKSYINPAPLTEQESKTMHRDSLTDIDDPEEVEGLKELDFSPRAESSYTPSPSEEPTTKYSSVCKIKTAKYLDEALVIKFEALLTATKVRADEGALLLSLIDSDGELQDVWFPKKCCSNLHMLNQTVCVWDKMAQPKIDDLGGLAIEPLYYSEYIEQEGEP